MNELHLEEDRRMQTQGLDPDDPTNSYMLQAGARLCKCLGEEFVPYLSVVMPPLLHAAELKPDISVQDEADSEGDDDDDDDDEVWSSCAFSPRLPGNGFVNRMAVEHEACKFSKLWCILLDVCSVLDQIALLYPTECFLEGALQPSRVIGATSEAYL